jgi:hypothetical protein
MRPKVDDDALMHAQDSLQALYENQGQMGLGAERAISHQYAAGSQMRVNAIHL